MRLPFFPKQKAKAPSSSTEGGEEKKKDESPRAQRKAAAKKRAWDAEQERRRLTALARWESALQDEPAGTASLPLPQPRLVVSAEVGAAAIPQLVAGPIDERHVTSAQGRLERRGKHHRKHHQKKSSTSSSQQKTSKHRRSRRFLDIDHLDELSELSTSDDESVISASSRGSSSRHRSRAPNLDFAMAMTFPPAAAPVTRPHQQQTTTTTTTTAGLGSSPTAQLYQVAAMRELPGLQGCATRQAPSSFFVDMFLLDEVSDTSVTSEEDKAAQDKAVREAPHRKQAAAPRSSSPQPSRRQ